MEDYLKSEHYDEGFSFAYFLRQYIKRLDKKDNEFAFELNIKPTVLSQLVNKHRDPSLKIIMRLEAHSNKIFPAIMWFNLFTKEKALEFMKNNNLRRDEGKQVRKRLAFNI
jgi:plasmid maintenance system antidote protein VapI